MLLVDQILTLSTNVSSRDRAEKQGEKATTMRKVTAAPANPRTQRDTLKSGFNAIILPVPAER